MKKTIYILSILCGLTTLVQAQEQEAPKKTKKAWEIGLGGSALQLTRFSVLDYMEKADGGHHISTNKRDFLFGGNLYIARELNPYLFVDLQGTAAYTKDPVRGGHEHRLMYMGGLGLQWRWGAHLRSRYIDPYLRIGANYMYKNFDIHYQGSEALKTDRMYWDYANEYNKEGKDRHHLLPVSLGAGVNMWLTDRFGLGLQGDYLYMPYKNVPNILQGTVRVLWRIGGESKKPAPQISYVERVVEKVVEKPVLVERIVKEPAEPQLCELFNNIYFDFDKATIRKESEQTIREIAAILLKDTTRKYIIVGLTDARGSAEYNNKLSANRAAAVALALQELGVPKAMLKHRGAGKSMAYAPVTSSHSVREGDRKIYVERITNQEYWDILP